MLARQRRERRLNRVVGFDSVISDDELLGLDEFALLPENAEQIGAATIRRRSPASTSGPISALKWGDADPQVVFLHGGGQNAHTWDTVILGLGVPALAVDLPGHGRSAWREDGDYGPKLNAETLRPVLRELGARRRAWSSACRSAG